jgi:D-glycero-D-manno-heptose 1,7-bisphosphate phosphatase
MAAGERRGAVIFDRDGVLNLDVDYGHRPDQIVWIEGAMAAVKAVNDAGLYAFVATNQSGIGRGYFTCDDVEALHAWMNDRLAEAGARIDAFVYSPYHPEAVVEPWRGEHPSRKPGPGMILDLLARFPVDPARAVMIGDKDSDLAAAAAAGIEGVKFAGGSLLAMVEPIVARIAAGPAVTKPRS